jgi:primosomal protein N''
MIVDINGNGFKKPALDGDTFKFLCTLSFRPNPDLIYSNEQDLSFCREELTMELTISREEVENVSKLDKYNKFKARLEAMLHAVSRTCTALANPPVQTEKESVE